MRPTMAFEDWFANEVGNGLVDIKLAVFPGKDVTSDAIQSEIIVAETMLKFGLTRPDPVPKKATLDAAMQIFAKTNLQ